MFVWMAAICGSVIFAAELASGQAVTRSTFSYQGRLEKAGTAYTGTADVIAALYDAASGGRVVAGPVSVANVTVTDGVFTVPIDFGIAEPQQRRYLEIQVRTPAGGGAYTTLGPRQPVDVTPRAASAIRADSAEPFTVAYDASPLTLDQSQTLTGSGSSAVSNWQSFTAGVTGNLTHVAMMRNGTVNLPNMLLRVYSGEGVGGAKLAEQVVACPPIVGEVVWGLTRPVSVAVGQKYTIEILQPFGGTISFLCAPANPYGGGVSSVGAGTDFYFKTWIGSAPGDVTLRSRFFGVNNPTPDSTLDVLSSDAVVLTAQSESAVGAWLNLRNTTAGGVYWRMISTGSGNGEGAGKLLIGHGSSAAIHTSVMTMQQNGNIGIGTSAPTQRLTVAGNVLANNVAVPSSGRFKHNVAPMEDALERLLKLRGVTFDWNEEFAKQRPGREHDIGFVAEDVAKVFPEVVFYDESGNVTGMDYSRLTAVAVQAIKQLKAENDDLKARLERIEAKLK
jgi:hypothetical protein